ncbi:MAG: YkgJ family cysteine cluster protein [Myxococcales bacterium]|nr:YkgJ family cysteine cluster protein [Myxococcales bacterium]
MSIARSPHLLALPEHRARLRPSWRWFADRSLRRHGRVALERRRGPGQAREVAAVWSTPPASISGKAALREAIELVRRLQRRPSPTRKGRANHGRTSSEETHQPAPDTAAILRHPRARCGPRRGADHDGGQRRHGAAPVQVLQGDGEDREAHAHLRGPCGRRRAAHRRRSPAAERQVVPRHGERRAGVPGRLQAPRDLAGEDPQDVTSAASSGAPRLLPTVRARGSRYSYRCAGCGRCCYDKLIHLNPYEVLRLARRRGLSTSELIARYTSDAGTVLASDAGGACVFLEQGGCAVHADRPLVCRLYPLGRVVGDDGAERFVELEPHPASAGSHGEDGSVAEWLEHQGAAPYIEAAARYHAVLERMVALLEQAPGAPPSLDEALADAGAELDETTRVMDLDATIADYAARKRLALPGDLERQVELHLESLNEWLDEME